MKKQFLFPLLLTFLSGCHGDGYVYPLSVSFSDRTGWNGKIIPARQGCRKVGGKGNTPSLHITGIPEETNLLIMEINDLGSSALSENGGLGSIGFYHNGEPSALLLPVPGESYELPPYAFKEKSNRVDPAKPYAYQPPCLEKKHYLSVTVKAVKRTGSFDKQKTVLLGEGKIGLGRY